MSNNDNDGHFLTKFDPSTTLTDKERNEIDSYAKIVIQQCLDRIKKLEESEQGIEFILGDLNLLYFM